MDVRTVDAEVVQFAVAHAAEFGNRLTVLAPVVERASDVHFGPLSRACDPPAAACPRWPLFHEAEYMLRREELTETRFQATYAFSADLAAKFTRFCHELVNE